MAKELEHKNAIRADNIGHKLLSKMGWVEGQGVGAASNGMTAPIQAGGMKGDNRGLGAQEVGGRRRALAALTVLAAG
jgi:splicing factor 4